MPKKKYLGVLRDNEHEQEDSAVGCSAVERAH
jgi:hypothetical protein